MRDWLRALRKKKQYTMKDMGRKLCISESYYCEIENGNRKRKMDIALIGALAGIFEVSIATIANYEQKWVEENQLPSHRKLA